MYPATDINDDDDEDLRNYDDEFIIQTLWLETPPRGMQGLLNRRTEKKIYKAL